MPWIPLLSPSIHEAAEAWDNLLVPVADASGIVQAIICVSRDVTEKTLMERELQDVLEREQLLACELQHRMKTCSPWWAG